MATDVLQSSLNISNIPVGDKFRLGTETLLTVADTTVLNIASGGGILWGVMVSQAGSSGVYSLNSFKVTVDGAAQRNLGLTGAGFRMGIANQSVFIQTPIKFKNSLTVTFSDSNAAGGSDIYVTAIYSVN